MSEQKSPGTERFVAHEQNVEQLVKRIFEYEQLVLDCETSGLKWAQDDRMFALQIATRDFSVYFNFQDYPAEGVKKLDKAVVLHLLAPYLLDRSRTIIGHNIIFDVHMLEAEGLEVLCKIEDTQTRAQVLYNRYGKYSLKECAKRIGEEKLGDVMEYLEEHGLYRESFDPWSGDKIKDPDFTAVPFSIMCPYGFTDVEVTLKLYNEQEAQLQEQGRPQTLDIESGVASVIVRMEKHGIRIEREYTKQAMVFERERAAACAAEFERLAGIPFVDSVEGIGSALEASGVRLGKTEDGNPSLASWVLEDAGDNPLARLVLEHRDRSKRGNTYFSNFLRYSDRDGFVHPSFKPRGAFATGRMSGSQPNFQNITKGETCEFPVRKAIRPRDGRALVELDYAAQEFRLLVEYGGEEELADRIIAGEDPHTATGQMAGIDDRAKVKVLNFGIPYGMGAATLSKKMGNTVDEAKLFKAKFMRRLPGIKNFLYEAGKRARIRGYVTSWDGCRFYYPDPDKSYKAANSIIQGGCAAIMKQGLVNLQEFIVDNNLKTLILATVHDSVLLDMPPDEFRFIQEFKRCLERAYPHKILPMGTSLEYSFTTWHDLIKLKEGELPPG
jgi:DNA polymerase-1